MSEQNTGNQEVQRAPFRKTEICILRNKRCVDRDVYAFLQYS